MENLSRMSSSYKDKHNNTSKLLSSYTSHTRCESVSRPSKNGGKKIQKLHTQMISSRKYNSTFKNINLQNQIKDSISPYRTSFSSIKGKKKKNSCAGQNGKCLSSHNLKDCDKNLLNSSQLFNSLYVVQPMEMICLLDKENKQSLRSTQNRKKKPSTSKNQVVTKRSIHQNNLIANCWKQSQQNLKAMFQRSKSKDTNKSVKKSKQYQRKKQSLMLSPTELSSKLLENQDQLLSPYNDIVCRTFHILSDYENKMKKLYEDKITYQRLYQKSRVECENLRKSLKKKEKKYNLNYVKQDVRNTKDTLKISIDNFKK